MSQMVKNLPVMQETWVQSLGWEDPLEKEMTTNSCILAWIYPSHGQSSLEGYSPWLHKESDMTEQLTLSLSLGRFLKISLPVSIPNIF